MGSGVGSVWLPSSSTNKSEKRVVSRGPPIDSGNPVILIFFLRLRPSEVAVLAASLVLQSANFEHFSSSDLLPGLGFGAGSLPEEMKRMN